MAKRSPKGKQSDFLRFRPYHAFTTPAEMSREAGRNRAMRLLILAAFAFAILVGSLIAFARLH